MSGPAALRVPPPEALAILIAYSAEARVLECRPQIAGNAAEVADLRVTVTKESASGLFMRAG
jgi:hypothetical protein